MTKAILKKTWVYTWCMYMYSVSIKVELVIQGFLSQDVVLKSVIYHS